ncbi:MAG: MgtC/SapB family protein [Rhodoferax sp.]|nr:MgtC/SapB family protein [Rhodoferax sp.]
MSALALLLDQAQRLGLALAIGFLVGVERGWKQRDEREGERAAGLRTFALSGLLGGVTALLAPLGGGGVAIALTLSFCLAFAWRFNRGSFCRERQLCDVGDCGPGRVRARRLCCGGRPTPRSISGGRRHDHSCVQAIAACMASRHHVERGQISAAYSCRDVRRPALPAGRAVDAWG